MRPHIKYALRQEDISETNTKAVYYNDIFTHPLNFVKQKIKQILRSFLNDEMSGATPHHFQRISDIDGEQVNATLKESIVSIVDKHGGTARFSAYLVPEMLATLLEIDKKFGRRFAHD